MQTAAVAAANARVCLYKGCCNYRARAWHTAAFCFERGGVSVFRVFLNFYVRGENVLGMCNKRRNGVFWIFYQTTRGRWLRYYILQCTIHFYAMVFFFLFYLNPSSEQLVQGRFSVLALFIYLYVYTMHRWLQKRRMIEVNVIHGEKYYI